jgi:CXXX repeat radical SAM target protein
VAKGPENLRNIGTERTVEEKDRMKKKTEMGKEGKQLSEKMDRRRFLKAGGKVVPALAVLGLALAAPQPARADDCSNTCANSCAVGCTSCTGTCTGGCEGNCENTCKDSCGDACGGTCAGDCKGTCEGACNSTSK